MDLNKKSIEELNALKVQIEEKICEKTELEKRQALDDARQLVAGRGFVLEELLANKPKKPAVAKFRDPENPSRTWSGRGRRPDWIKSALAKGIEEDDLRI